MRLKVVADETEKAHLRLVKSGKKTSLDYKVLPTAISRPEAVVGVDTGRPRLGHE